MRLIRLIPEHRRALVKELITFGLVGGFNTAFGQILFNVFLMLGALKANTISTAIATVGSFILNRNITYRHRARTQLRRELPLFALLNLVGLGIQLAILDGGERLFGVASTDRLEINMIRFGGVAVGTVFLLLTYRTFVFKKHPVEAEAAILSVAPMPAQVVASAADSSDSDDPVDAVEPDSAGELDDVEFEMLTEPLEADLQPITADAPAGHPGLR